MRQGWGKRSEEGKGRDEELFRGAGFAGVVIFVFCSVMSLTSPTSDA